MPKWKILVKCRQEKKKVNKFSAKAKRNREWQVHKRNGKCAYVCYEWMNEGWSDGVGGSDGGIIMPKRASERMWVKWEEEKKKKKKNVKTNVNYSGPSDS